MVAAYLVGAQFGGLTNSYLTDEERAAVDPNSEEAFNRMWGSKIQVIGWNLYAAILWLLKVCVTTFYSRLTYVIYISLVQGPAVWIFFGKLTVGYRAGLDHLRMRVIIAYVLLGVTYLAVVLTLCLSCQPMHHFWQISPNPGPLCQPTNSPACEF